MDELDHNAVAVASQDAVPDVAAQIASFRAAGADLFDPVGFHHIEALARRALTQPEAVKRNLDAKLAQLLATFKERFVTARSTAQEAVTESTQHYPHAANDLQGLFNAGDFKGLQRLIDSLKSGEQCTSLNALVRRLEQHTADNAETQAAGFIEARPELKTVRNFRHTWSKLSVGRQVAKAFEQAPKNAGPINSHMLMLRSLALMRDISPDYLNRFISYADTLLSLDQDDKEKPVKAAKKPAAKTAKTK
jgi:hypothetical protein